MLHAIRKKKSLVSLLWILKHCLERENLPTLDLPGQTEIDLHLTGLRVKLIYLVIQ